MLKFYFNGAPNPNKVALFLEESGLAFELVPVDTRKGEQYTICDPYLFTLGLWLEGDGVDMKTLPKVMAHRKRMSARAAVLRVLAVEQG